MIYLKKTFRIQCILGILVWLMSGASIATNFKIAVGDGGNSAQEQLALKFTELLEEKTDGKHTATLFLNGQLGSEQTTVNDAALGSLDMSVLASNNIAPFSPSLAILSLPYILRSIEEAEIALSSDIVADVVEQTIKDAGVRILGWTYSGFRTLSNSKQPVKKLTDLQGLVIRVPKSDIIIDTYKSWDVSPTPMAWAETFTALQQKVVDAQDTPYITINAMKFYEVQKYLTEFHYNFLLEPIIVSEQVFQDQDEKTQNAMIAAGEEATVHSIQWLQEKEAGIKDELVNKHGMQIDFLEDEDDWAKRAQDAIWPNYYDQIGGKEKVNQLLRTMGREEI